jgi:hypothetical protein
MEISENEGPSESRGIDGTMKCGKMPPNFSISKTGSQWEDNDLIGRRKHCRPWPGNRPQHQINN